VVKLSAILLAVPSGGWLLPDQYDGLDCRVTAPPAAPFSLVDGEAMQPLISAVAPTAAEPTRKVRRLCAVVFMGLRMRAHGTGPGLLTLMGGPSLG
jgi:hypothetical protein